MTEGTTGKIHLLVVDDQRLMREGLRTILELEDDFVVDGIAANGREALEMCCAAFTPPNVVLMDIRMPEMDGIAATSQLARQMPDVKVIILTTFDDDELIVQGLRAGAKTYLLKDLPSERLAEIIRATHRGEVVLQSHIAAKLVQQAAGGNPPGKAGQAAVARRDSAAIDGNRTGASAGDIVLADPLTVREREVLALMVEGLSNPDIARKLYIGEGTVKNYISSIYAKLGTSDRTQAVLMAIRNRLI